MRLKKLCFVYIYIYLYKGIYEGDYISICGVLVKPDEAFKLTILLLRLQ